MNESKAEGDVKAPGMASGSFWAVLDNLAQQGLSFIIFAILARLLNPAEFGLLTIAHLFILFSRLVVLDALAMPVIRAKEPDDGAYSALFWRCTAAGLLLCACMFLSAGPVSALFSAPSLAPVLQGMSLSILFFGMVRSYEARLVRQMQFKQLAIRSTVSVMLGGVLGIALAYRGWGAMSLVVQQVMAAGLALLLVVLQSGWLPSLAWRARPSRYWHDVRQVSVSGILSFANSNGDSLLVSIFLGPYATGLYNLAKRLTSAVYLVITASLLRVSLPVFAAASGKPEQLRQAYLQLLAMMLFLMLPMLLFQAALAEPLVATVFGQKWLPASSTIAALALLYCLSSVAELNNYVLFALGHSRWPPLLGILQLSLAVILAACFSQYGLLAMSLSFAAAYLLMLPWSQHLACKSMDLPWTTFLVALQPVLAGAAALLLTLYAMARWWQGSAIVLLVLALFAGAITYLLPMLLLGRALRGTAGGFDPLSLLRQLRNLKHRGAAAD